MIHIETAHLLFQWVHYTALGFWTGGIFFFSVVSAPAVHRSLASHAVISQIVRSSLKRLNYLEIFCCLVLLTTTLAAQHVKAPGAVSWKILLGLFLLMGATTGFYTFYLTLRMQVLESGQAGFDVLENGHPSKAAFQRLHRLYVSLMSFNFLLGMAGFYLSTAMWS